MVRVWLLGHLHRAGRVRPVRRADGAGPALVRPPRGPAVVDPADRDDRRRGRRLRRRRGKPVQPAGIAEFRHPGAAALADRRLLRLPAAVLLRRRPVRQPVVRPPAAPGPGLRRRPDRRRGGHPAGARADVRRPPVPPRRVPAAAAVPGHGRPALAAVRDGVSRVAGARPLPQPGAAAGPRRVQRIQGDLPAAACPRQPRRARNACRRAASTTSSTTLPSGSIPTSRPTPRRSACRARRARSGCIATVAGSRPFRTARWTWPMPRPPCPHCHTRC